ncbi:sulfite exporter TauE/SafE family protein 2-like [Vigna umbellata]|uniref:sulfite exporter TauE/SafE family protein 2-like n=1 Tax=Vigna umbellata TaxID=87088 RepID=UPI001F5EE377|nr:sulfite exporter TauE/SafE family protein 2-like [Vigna umbellata]
MILFAFAYFQKVLLSFSLYPYIKALHIQLFNQTPCSFLQVLKRMKIFHSLTFFVLIFISFNPCNAEQAQTILDALGSNHFLEKIYEWGNGAQGFREAQIEFSGPIVLAGVLCFIASSISSAGGIGGGGLFIPILTIVAGLDLKIASSLSAFMVTGGSVANVLCNLCATSPKFGGNSLIDYDIALLSEPCMLLGVSVGVICNLVFPEWLITMLFAVFLTWSTSKTCNSGVVFWKIESEERRKEYGFEGLENRLLENGNEVREGGVQVNKEKEEMKSVEEQVLVPEENIRVRIPWLKLVVLLLVWFTFFSLYLLRGNKYGQSIIPMEPCGVGYWILSSAQLPLALFFTAWIVYRKDSHQDENLMTEDPCLSSRGPSNKLIFPIMALLAGILGGVFGIGGGMLISPLLLHVGIAPEVTAATCSFMVFFSSTMSALQYLLLGMDHIETALMLAIVCFVASLIGLLVVQRAIQSYGRPSIIVFSVSIVMTLSVVLMTSFGMIRTWKDYVSGRYMGFKLPC